MKLLRALIVLAAYALGASALLWAAFWLLDRGRDAPADRIVIGSKADTEGILLAEVMAQLIERKTGLDVERRSALGGTQICFEALRAGAIDLYPEYTGTALVALLGKPAIGDRERVFSIVSEEFSRRFELVWLPAAAFDNTYALAMADERAERLGIRRISDLARHPSLSAGFTAEFLARDDGYPGLAKTYGLAFERAPRSLEAGLMYAAARDAEVDLISAYATDGRIDKMRLRVLIDDRRFFPPYQAAPVVRRDTLARHPELRSALAPLAGRITDAEMRRLNAAVDIDRRRPEEVARELVDRLLAAAAR